VRSLGPGGFVARFDRRHRLHWRTVLSVEAPDRRPSWDPTAGGRRPFHTSAASDAKQRNPSQRKVVRLSGQNPGRVRGKAHQTERADEGECSYG
jgi:hypothetical protein